MKTFEEFLNESYYTKSFNLSKEPIFRGPITSMGRLKKALELLPDKTKKLYFYVDRENDEYAGKMGVVEFPGRKEYTMFEVWRNCGNEGVTVEEALEWIEKSSQKMKRMPFRICGKLESSNGSGTSTYFKAFAIFESEKYDGYAFVGKVDI